MSWLADLFGSLLFSAGVPVPQRKGVTYEGTVTVVDDPVKKRTRVIVNGGGLAAVTVADYVQPSLNGTAQITTASGVNSGWIVGTCLAVAVAGVYLVVSVDSATLTTIKLLGALADGTSILPGSSVAAGKLVAPSGAPGASGGTANTLLGQAALTTNLTLAANINFATMDSSTVVALDSSFPGATVQLLAVVALTSTADAVVSFRFLLDNVSGVSACDVTFKAGDASTVELFIPGHVFAAGAHTIELQWSTSADSAQCWPTSANEFARMSLLQVG